MKIDISEIKYDLGAVKQVDEDFKIDDLKLRGRNIEFREPLHLNVQITNSGDDYLVTGRISGKGVAECNRCLEKFDYPFDVGISDEIPKDEMENENYIDLTPTIREHLILEIPIKTLCNEECKGLCLKCGQNLNIKECGCDRHIIDPRLVKLKELFQKDKNNKED
ncbi:hypothetical protein BBF96_04645 [Anoxybacter fermentans]|uniref:DNA-binding protein n=1 Tax=Anoxybacter fermentans TaxID=1323375 RepID=A0A3Q9HPK4_9FIRM|nr:DUF177 domain-containing protein [Anoxybacter fermentans]AZR72742.1 hypothetical protein BBF96_04645 [Anoxybacter fermentans]